LKARTSLSKSTELPVITVGGLKYAIRDKEKRAVLLCAEGIPPSNLQIPTDIPYNGKLVPVVEIDKGAFQNNDNI
jgi:hypothetical protein